MKTFTHLNWICSCNCTELERKYFSYQGRQSMLILNEQNNILSHLGLKERAKRAVMYMTMSTIDGYTFCRKCGERYIAIVPNPFYNKPLRRRKSNEQC